MKDYFLFLDKVGVKIDPKSDYSEIGFYKEYIGEALRLIEENGLIIRGGKIYTDDGDSICFKGCEWKTIKCEMTEFDEIQKKSLREARDFLDKCSLDTNDIVVFGVSRKCEDEKEFPVKRIKNKKNIEDYFLFLNVNGVKISVSEMGFYKNDVDEAIRLIGKNELIILGGDIYDSDEEMIWFDATTWSSVDNNLTNIDEIQKESIRETKEFLSKCTLSDNNIVVFVVIQKDRYMDEYLSKQ